MGGVSFGVGLEVSRMGCGLGLLGWGCSCFNVFNHSERLRSGSSAIEDGVSRYVLALPLSHMRADVPGEAFSRA